MCLLRQKANVLQIQTKEDLSTYDRLFWTYQI